MTIAALTSAAQARAFMVAGNARVTLRSKTTDTRFTFRVRKAKDAEVYFVSLINGPDNENSFAYFGFLREKEGKLLFNHGGRKARVSADAASVKAFAWTWTWLTADSAAIPANLEIWHEGRCGRCGRALTVPESIESGLGPECRGLVSDQQSFFAEAV